VSKPAVVVTGLAKRYDGRTVVDDLSFAVERGEVFALLGPNGAGKTTTIEIIEGYRRPDDGNVRVLDLDPVRDGTALRARMGLMLQAGGVYPQARPIEILRLFARFYAAPHDPDRLIDASGLGRVRDSRYKVLSGGEKQRLGLCLALIGRPELAVLDEPTAGMDPQAKSQTRALIDDLRRDGVTILLTTHELADAERLADRVALIDRGRLIAQGSPAELTSEATRRLRFRLTASLAESDREALRGALGASVDRPGSDGAATLVDEGAGTYRFEGSEPTPRLVAELGAWCAQRGLLIVELRTVEATLEERYLELLGEHDEQAGDAAEASRR
jgi:ABC-2 type transport system ATP-binding protein